MRVGHLQAWPQEATREDTPDMKNWIKVVSLIKESFGYSDFEEKCTWQTVVLILKDDR